MTADCNMLIYSLLESRLSRHCEVRSNPEIGMDYHTGLPRREYLLAMTECFWFTMTNR